MSKAQGNYDALMSISEKGLEELRWWKSNINTSFNDIYHGTPTATLTTDASQSGWGAIFQDSNTQGLWKKSEKTMHINTLELKAIFFGLKSLVKESNFHLQILCDNTTAVHTLNNMGTSHSSTCNSLIQEIWRFASNRNIWLSASHILGKLNKDADEKSRKFAEFTEWKLNPTKFRKVLSNFNR